MLWQCRRDESIGASQVWHEGADPRVCRRPLRGTERRAERICGAPVFHRRITPRGKSINFAVGNECVKIHAIPHKTTFRATGIVGINQRLWPAVPGKTIARVECHSDRVTAMVFPVNHLGSYYPVFTLHYQEIVNGHVFKWGSFPGMASVLGGDQALIIELRRPAFKQYRRSIPERGYFQHELKFFQFWKLR